MKIKKKDSGNVATDKTVTNTAKLLTKGVVQLTHHQAIKQSANYQSAECSFGITLNVPDDKTEIEAGFIRATNIVEKHLASKFQEQRTLLEKMTGN